MHCQIYDIEDEFEPRITPKPIVRPDFLAVPCVPEVSLISEQSIVQHSNDDINKNTILSRRLTTKSTELSDDATKHNAHPISPNLDKYDSYAAWKEQNYFKENYSTNGTGASSSCKNAYNCNHVSIDLQDASIQNQKKNKTCDIQSKLTDATFNDKAYDKRVKFRYPKIDNSYDCEQEIPQSSSDKKYLLPRKTVQRVPSNVTDHSARVPTNTIVDTLKKNEYLQIPYAGYSYPLQQFYPPSYSNHNLDNNETVQTLLQLVNTQSEQIKTLQLQIDRLVRMQEESLRLSSKATCPCSSTNQIFRYPSINCYDTTNSLSHMQSHNQGVTKNSSQNLSVVEKKDNCGENKNSNKLEVAFMEQQSKKAFMEQKVSIGVMTSFEFTLQNNPFLMDSEIYEKKETHKESNNINQRNTVNMHDTTTESVNRYKNTFARKPRTVQLENIVEDAESYLSSSHQQSSNCNANSSIRDSERHTPKQLDLYNTTNTLESSKNYQRLDTDFSQEKMQERMYVGKSGDVNKHIRKTNACTSSSCSPANVANCNRTIITDVNYIAKDKKNSNEKTNANRPFSRDIHSPVMNYYQSQKSKEYNPYIVKQIKDVDDSIILSGGDLRILERPPPTPEPSIHVEMQEYISDDESDKLKRTSKIGWTFYDNVLGQVNEILQNSDVLNSKDQNDSKIAVRKIEQGDDVETRTLNTVKAATLEQLRRLGISLTENNEHKEQNGNDKLDFDSSFYPHLDHQANIMHTTSVVNETNTSMHMKALALKYLSDEQLAEIALNKQGSSLKHFMLSNMQGTNNMSLATMRYLERYQLLPGRNNVQIENTDQHVKVTPKHDFQPVIGKNIAPLRRFPSVQTPGTTCPSRILDISTLKQQPKLL